MKRERQFIDVEALVETSGMPLHMIRRFFPEVVRRKVRAVEVPGRAVLRSERGMVGPVPRENEPLHELPGKIHAKATVVKERGSMGPEEVANEVKVAVARAENCQVFASKGKTKYVKPKWDITGGMPAAVVKEREKYAKRNHI